MNRALFLLALVAMMMASCQQESLVDTQLDSFDLSNASMEDVLADANLEEIQTFGDPATEGRKKHRRDSLCTPVAIEDLQAAIKEYIANNYAGAEIVRACQMLSTGNFVVMIKVGEKEFKLVEFTSDGQFVKELDPRKKGPKGPGRHLTPVDPANLLASITDYIAQNYAGAVIKRAGTNANGEFIVTFEVNGTLKSLLFDASGNFVKELR